MLKIFLKRLKKKREHQQSSYLPSFLELFVHNEEFAFRYEGKEYEIIWGGENKLQLFLADSIQGTLLCEYASKEEFLAKCEINGKKLVDEIPKFEI